MKLFATTVLFISGLSSATAQSVTQADGPIVTISAVSEVKWPNDHANVTYTAEERNADKTQAVSKVEAKMKRAIALIREIDPTASLKSTGYESYPVYADDKTPADAGRRKPVAWRVSQSLNVDTTRLDLLPRTVAAVQDWVAVHRLQFGLTAKAKEQADDKRIKLAYQYFQRRANSVAQAMNRSAADFVVEAISLDGADAAMPIDVRSARSEMALLSTQDAVTTEGPRFEPGETTLTMQISGKIRFAR